VFRVNEEHLRGNGRIDEIELSTDKDFNEFFQICHGGLLLLSVPTMFHRVPPLRAHLEHGGAEIKK
jgi:hypothetical protein